MSNEHACAMRNAMRQWMDAATGEAGPATLKRVRQDLEGQVPRLEEALSTASEAGLQLLGDMQAHAGRYELMEAFPTLLVAVAEGASSAAAAGNVPAVEVYLNVLVTANVYPRGCPSDTQARRWYMAALHRLVTAGAGSQATDVVLLHLLRMSQNMHLVIFLDCHPAWALFDVLVKVRQSFGQAQLQDMQRVLHAVGQVVYTWQLNLKKPEGDSCSEQQVVRNLFALVASLPAEEQVQWEGLITAVVTAPSGVSIMELRPYVGSIQWAAIKARQVAWGNTYLERVVSWDDTSIKFDRSWSREEFRNARRCLVEHVAAGMTAGNPLCVEFALHFMVRDGSPDPWCLGQSAHAAPLAREVVAFLERSLPAPPPLQQAVEAVQQAHQQPAGTPTLDAAICSLASSVSGCRLLGAAKLWPAIGRYVGVRERQGAMLLEGVGQAIWSYLATEQVADGFVPLYEQLLACAAPESSQLVCDRCQLHGLPDHVPSSVLVNQPVLLALALEHFDPSWDEAEVHDPNAAFAERLLYAAESPELAGAIRARFEDPAGSKQVRAGALLAIARVVASYPGMREWLADTADQMARPKAMLDQFHQDVARLVGSALAGLNSRDLVHLATPHAVAAASADRVKQLVLELQRRNQKIANLEAQLMRCKALHQGPPSSSAAAASAAAAQQTAGAKRARTNDTEPQAR